MFIPRPIKKIVKVLRGDVSPFLVYLVVLTGFLFGLVPGFSGLHMILLVVLLILNMPVGLFLFCAAVGKSVCFASAPVLYYAGVFVQAHFWWLLSFLDELPIVGLTNFGRYSVAGSLLLGIIVGAVCGLVLSRSVVKFRKKLMDLQEGSEKFKKWYSNRWVRILDRIVIGKRGRSTLRGKARYVRKAGVVIVIILLVIVSVVVLMVNRAGFRELLANKLTEANGAEVNIGDFEVSVLGGSLSMSKLEVTNPKKPETNKMEAAQLTGKIGIYDILAGKLVMDKIEVAKLKFDTPREQPGKVVEDVGEKRPEFKPGEYEVGDLEPAKLERYLKKAEQVKEWLGRLQGWLPRPGKKAEREVPEEYLSYLRAEAPSPVSPKIMVRKVIIDGIELGGVFGSSKVVMENISDAAAAAGKPLFIEVKSTESEALARAKLEYGMADGVPFLEGMFSGFNIGRTGSAFTDHIGMNVTEGTASGRFSGKVSAEDIDVAAIVEISGLKADSSGEGFMGLDSEESSEVLFLLKELKLKLRIVGPFEEPRVAVDAGDLKEQLQKAVTEAGKERLKKELGKKLEEEVGEKLPEELKELRKEPGKLLEDVFKKKEK